MAITVDEALAIGSIPWVVAYVGGWKPREVIDYLRRVGYAPYCPETRYVQLNARIRGPNGGQRGRRIVSKPLFGGYLFVGEQTRPLDRDVHPRIFHILGDSTGHFHVNLDPLRGIRAAELDGRWDYSRSYAERFPGGKRVAIKTGHFAEFNAVVREAEESGRLRVRLNLFGGEVEATVDASRIAA